MKPCSPSSPCRRHLMLAAVAASVLVLTTPAVACAEHNPQQQGMADELLADKDGHALPPVSADELAKAKTEVDKLHGMSQAERVDYLMARHADAKPGNFQARKADMRARRAYINSLPDKERTAFKAQMKEDKKLMREKMKAKWDAMTPEEREAAKAKRKAEFDKLPDDVKAKIKERRAHMKPMEGEKNHMDDTHGHQPPPPPPAEGKDGDLPPPPPGE